MIRSFPFRAAVRCLLALVLPLSLGVALAARGETVTFPAVGGETRLLALLEFPDAPPPHPAVVLLHGCGGLWRGAEVKPIYKQWAAHLRRAGYATLLVDSAGPRGIRYSCGKRQARRILYRGRPKDAYGALAYLQGRPDIEPARIGLIGWSQGGGIVLLSIVEPSIGRPVPPPRHDFRAAIAFYPAVCNERWQSRPFTKVPPGGWTTEIPLLVLHGAADNWTPAAPCRRFIEAAAARGAPTQIRLLKGAHHGFDAPGLPIRRLGRLRTRSGEQPIIGTDPAARAAALDLVPKFLNRHLPRE